MSSSSNGRLSISTTSQAQRPGWMRRSSGSAAIRAPRSRAAPTFTLKTARIRGFSTLRKCAGLACSPASALQYPCQAVHGVSSRQDEPIPAPADPSARGCAARPDAAPPPRGVQPLDDSARVARARELRARAPALRRWAHLLSRPPRSPLALTRTSRARRSALIPSRRGHRSGATTRQPRLYSCRRPGSFARVQMAGLLAATPPSSARPTTAPPRDKEPSKPCGGRAL